MSERKLASVQKVVSVRPIPDADAIECVRVLGWDVVAKKGEFKAGDLCVYFEIDSVLPVVPEYEFLRKSCYVKKDWLQDGEGFRLKTVRLRKQVSQGLVVPVTLMGPMWDLLEEGEDLTATLRVTKWDPPVPAQLSGLVKGNFPSFIPKTDQERIQNLPEVFNDPEIFHSHWEVTVKLDGSSCTVYEHEGNIGVCSRNLELKMDQEGNTFVDLAKSIADRPWKELAIQGEAMGPGIQDNREKLAKHELHVFDIYDITLGHYMSPTTVRSLCSAYGLKHVPVLHEKITMMELGIFNIDDMLKFAEGASLNHPEREGVVFKRVNDDFSFKCIANSFLLREK